MRIQYSAITERKSKAYKECANGNQLCVISAISCVCASSVQWMMGNVVFG